MAVRTRTVSAEATVQITRDRVRGVEHACWNNDALAESAAGACVCPGVDAPAAAVLLGIEGISAGDAGVGLDTGLVTDV